MKKLKSIVYLGLTVVFLINVDESTLKAADQEVSVAIIQAPPVFMNLSASLEKAERLIVDASNNGASLVVFPEAWLPGYPVWTIADSGFSKRDARVAYRKLFENSIEIPGNEISRLSEVCRENEVFLVLGVNERNQSGTLYNTAIYFNDKGDYLGKHRKLVPTYHERMIWGQGDGSTLQVFETELGVLGGLLCYENLMPLARYTLYSEGVQIYTALWPSIGPEQQHINQTIAFEGKLFLVSACTYLSPEEYPEDFPFYDKFGDIHYFHGGSSIVGPDGKFIVEPNYSADTVYGKIDLNRIIEEKQIVDPVGHYSRPEIFTLQVNRERMKTFETKDRTGN